jgi:hypothetical protein
MVINMKESHLTGNGTSSFVTVSALGASTTLPVMSSYVIPMLDLDALEPEVERGFGQAAFDSILMTTDTGGDVSSAP